MEECYYSRESALRFDDCVWDVIYFPWNDSSNQKRPLIYYSLIYSLFYHIFALATTPPKIDIMDCLFVSHIFKQKYFNKIDGFIYSSEKQESFSLLNQR